MSIVMFAPVRREGTHVIVTGFGESGTGKTLSLLMMGRGLVGPHGKLAMLDTERGRGRIYEKAVTNGYLYAELTPPFTPERYIEAIIAAEEAGVEALMIDSGTHEWEGFGGILEIADEGKDSQGRSLQGLVKWAKPKARHKKYVQRLLDSPMHLLISLRAKEKMIQLKRGDVIPEGAKVGDIISDGYVPIQDKRFIYETTVQLFFPTKGARGVPVTEQGPLFKCPSDLLAAFPQGHRVTENTGGMIAEWVHGGTPVDREHETLRKAAEGAAGNGTPALREHYKGLTRPERQKLADQEDNLRSIAATADRDAIERGAHGIAPEGEVPLAATILARLNDSATVEDIDALIDEHAVAIAGMSAAEWTPLKAMIEGKRDTLSNTDNDH